MPAPSFAPLLLLILLAVFSPPANSLDQVDSPFLAFATKNGYETSASNDTPNIEPYRETFFSAAASKDALQEQLSFNSAYHDRQYKELRELVDRGGSNDQLLPKVEKAKRQFKTTRVIETQAAAGEEFKWIIDGVEYEGKTIGPLQFDKPHSSVSVTLQQYLLTQTAYTLVASVTVVIPTSYVRRGMGELSGADRRAFFEAVGVLYQTPTVQGKDKFGEYYVGMQDVWAAHNLFAVDDEHQLLTGASTSSDQLTLLAAARAHSGPNHSYRKQVDEKFSENSWLEIDGDVNDYADSSNLLLSSGSDEFDEDKKKGLMQTAAENSMLASHVGGSLSNFATFAAWFEKAVQSVDPAVSLPYFDEDGELGGTDFQSSTWTESYDMLIEEDRLMLGAGVGTGVTEEIVRVETVGKYTYVPIITHSEARELADGKRASVSKGFSVPLITKVRAQDNTNFEL